MTAFLNISEEKETRREIIAIEWRKREVGENTICVIHS